MYICSFWYCIKIAPPNLGTATQNEKCEAVFATQKKFLISNAAHDTLLTNQWTRIYEWRILL